MKFVRLRSFARYSRGRDLHMAILIVGLSLGQAITPAAAQSTNTAEVPSQLCRVSAVEGPAGPVQDLRASCGGRGLILGRITSFEAIPNEGLHATLVDARLGSERRVLLLSIKEDGQPLVEDLTGQVALAAGRGPMSGIDGVELDLSGFGQAGQIGVIGRPEDTGPARSSTLNLGQQIALEGLRQGESIQN